MLARSIPSCEFGVSNRRLVLFVFLKTVMMILALCTLLPAPVSAQNNPKRADKAVEGRPDLAGLSVDEVGAIERACNYEKQFSGPAAYYRCLQQQRAELQNFLGPNTKQQGINKPAKGLAPRPIEEPAARRAGIYIYKDPAGTYVPRKEEVRKGTLQTKKSPAEKLASPKEEIGDRPSPTTPPSISLQPTDPNRTPEKPETNLFPAAVGFIILFFVARAIYKKVPTKRCVHCNLRTPNTTRVCDACRTRIDNESAQAQERERQEHEARMRAEENRRQEEARAQEQRKRAEDAKREKPTSIADLQRLRGDEFESLIASLFKRDGYKITRCGGSGDEGIDLILHLGMDKDVVQCKRWKSDIGSPVIREFYGSMMHVGARHGFVITTASFSPSAREFSKGKPIILIDGRYLLSWINGTKSTRSDAGAHTTGGDGFNPHEVLQVNRGASKEEIKAAYLRLIKQYHPDKVSHLGKEFQEIAEEKAQAINRAYEILSSE